MRRNNPGTWCARGLQGKRHLYAFYIMVHSENARLLSHCDITSLHIVPLALIHLQVTISNTGQGAIRQNYKGKERNDS